MKRFTQRTEKGKAVCRCEAAYSLVHCTEVVGGEAIERFAELEDMIESGKLIFAPEATKKVCNVGDKVFMPWEYDGIYGVATLEITQIVENGTGTIYASNIESDDYDYLMKYNFGNFLEKDFGEKVFLNPEQAAMKLKEMKEHKRTLEIFEREGVEKQESITVFTKEQVALARKKYPDGVYISCVKTTYKDSRYHYTDVLIFDKDKNHIGNISAEELGLKSTI